MSGWQTVALGLLAALLWGGGDFFGGMGVKSAGGGARQALRVILSAHLMSLAVLLAWLGLRHPPPPPVTSLLWAAAGGAAGFFGLLAFYVALAGGEMGSSAALSGLLAAAIPALLSSWMEGAPGLLRLFGFALAAAAIWFIAAPASSSPASAVAHRSSRPLMLLAVVGGIGFGLYFIGLRLGNGAGVVMAMAAARLTSSLLCTLLLLGWRTSNHDASQTRWLSRHAWLWAVGVAVLDTGGNLFFIAATRTGRLDVAAVISSLYPASTIVLAALILRERPGKRQIVGMVLALVAVVLVAR